MMLFYIKMDLWKQCSGAYWQSGRRLVRRETGLPVALLCRTVGHTASSVAARFAATEVTRHPHFVDVEHAAPDLVEVGTFLHSVDRLDFGTVGGNLL
jgi:hypothetical protein